MGKVPAVKGTLWTRIGLGLVHYGPVLGIEQFLIKRTVSRCFPRTHASTPVRKHTPVEGSCDTVCLIRNCSVSRLVHNVHFNKRIIINKFSLRPIRFHRVPCTAGFEACKLSLYEAQQPLALLAAVRALAEGVNAEFIFMLKSLIRTQFCIDDE